MGSLIAALILASTLASQEPVEDGLEPGAGRELIRIVCTQCHTAELIVQSHMSRKTWDTTIGWMQETQGLGPLTADERKVILDYLESTQGLTAVDEDEASSPWAQPRYRPNPIW